MKALAESSGGRGMRGLWLMFGICAILSAAIPCHGQDWFQQAKLLAQDDGEPDHRFGQSVAVDGDVALIGAPGDYYEDYGYEAWIFRYVDGSWALTTQLLPMYVDTDDAVGYSVALDGDVAVISAPNYESGLGAAWVFRYNGGKGAWDEEAILQASDPDFRMFGASVAVEGDVVVVGAYTDDDHGDMAGAAYVFGWNGEGWSQDQKLVADDAQESAYFGHSVSISQGVIAIGAPVDDNANGTNAGAVYVFAHDGSNWQQEQKLLAMDGSDNDEFGHSVSIQGDALVAGSPNGQNKSRAQGTAYVFRYDGSSWDDEWKFEWNDAMENDRFGWSVAIETGGPEGDVVVIGAPGDGYMAQSPGYAVVHRNTGSGWDYPGTKVTASDGMNYDGFGTAVAVNQNTALIGAPLHDFGGVDAGAAYVFDYSRGWDETAKLVARDEEDEFEYFGTSVAVDGDVAVVGAPYGDLTGTVDVYRRAGSEWNWEARLVAPDTDGWDYYGWSVAIDGDVIIVGAAWADGFANESGAAYVFRYDQSFWVYETKLVGWDYLHEYALFGGSVAISGNVVVIGAPHVMEEGAAFVYRYDEDTSTWEEDDLLSEDNLAQDGEFGFSVSISSAADLIIVGAPGAYDFEGLAVIFRYEDEFEDWNDEAYLYWDKGRQEVGFGWSVAIEGDWAMCGVPYFDAKDEPFGIVIPFHYDDDDEYWEARSDLDVESGSSYFGAALSLEAGRLLVGAPGVIETKAQVGPGAAYVFDYDGGDDEWELTSELLASDGEDEDAFGLAVSLSGDTALIGAPFHGDLEPESGSAYVFVAGALENTYIGPEGGSWFEPTNWSLGDIPAEDQNVFIPNGGHVVIDAFPALSLSTTIQDGGSVTLDFNPLLAQDGLFIDAGGALYGDDYVNGDVFNHGLVSPGLPGGTSLATLSIDGTFTQYESGEILLQLGENGESDMLDASFHQVGLAGTLTVELADSYQGMFGDSFEVIAYDSILEGSGFDAMSLPEPAEPCLLTGYQFDDDSLDVFYELAPPSDVNVAELAKVLASDGEVNDSFGRSVSVHGNVAVIGAAYNSQVALWAGAAYVFRYDGVEWLLEAKLTASDGLEYDRFGYSVAIWDDVILVGAPGVDEGGEDAGAAYVFRYSGGTWDEEVKLPDTGGNDRGAGARFGCSASLHEDVAVIGAYLAMEGPTQNGAAYTYRYDGMNWASEAILVASDGAETDAFGWSVSVFNEVAVVGAFRNDVNGVDSGAAYVFGCDAYSWCEVAVLRASDGQADDWFGVSVAAGDGVIAVGASASDENGDDSGSVYIYRYDGLHWNEQTEIAPSDPDVEDGFGWAVSLSSSGQSLLVGAPFNDDEGLETGSAYLFRDDGTEWFEYAKLAFSDPAAGDNLGCAVSLRDDVAVIGAFGDQDNGALSGSAYLFDMTVLDDCNHNGAADNCDIEFGESEDQNGNGVPDECECAGDVNSDGEVNIDDLFAVLGAWGQCDDCPEDVNEDGIVDIDDVFAVLGEWGPC